MNYREMRTMKVDSQQNWLPGIGLGIIIASYLLLVFGSPMPIKIGVVEMVMGAGLIVGSFLSVYALFLRKDWSLLLPALFIMYLLLAPLLVGVVHRNSLSDISRDVAPLMFMTVLPWLIRFLPQDQNASYRLYALLFAILVIGLVSALQFHLGIVKLFGSMNIFISKYSSNPIASMNGTSNFSNDILHLFGLENANYQMFLLKCQDPALLFSAIYLLCIGLAHILIKPRRLIFGLLALAGGSFCAYEFAALGMRAFSGLTVMALVIYAIHLIRFRGLPIVNLIISVLLGLLLTYTQILNFAVQMWSKNQADGLNGRPGEIYAVFGIISQSVKTFLFGIGWGGIFANPIYNDSTTRYTHSLFSFLLLKAGIVGFTMWVLFVILLFRRVNLKNVRTSSHRLAVFLAASAVIIIGFFFEPTYKMLSFGLIVGLLLAVLTFTPVPNQEIVTEQKPA